VWLPPLSTFSCHETYTGRGSSPRTHCPDHPCTTMPVCGTEDCQAAAGGVSNSSIKHPYFSGSASASQESANPRKRMALISQQKTRALRSLTGAPAADNLLGVFCGLVPGGVAV
jgi:hypothetical protein